MVGVPYTDEMLEMAQTDFIQQANRFGNAGVVERYPGAQQRDFDGQPEVHRRWDAPSPYKTDAG